MIHFSLEAPRVQFALQFMYFPKNVTHNGDMILIYEYKIKWKECMGINVGPNPRGAMMILCNLYYFQCIHKKNDTNFSYYYLFLLIIQPSPNKKFDLIRPQFLIESLTINKLQKVFLTTNNLIHIYFDHVRIISGTNSSTN